MKNILDILISLIHRLFSIDDASEDSVAQEIADETPDDMSDEQTECKTNNSDMNTEHDYSKVIVCLDNGHAESTPGKRSPYSCCGTEPALPLMEYKWNREMVDIIGTRLRDLGFGVEVIVPEVKEDIALTARYKRANAVKAANPDKKCILVSVHANAHGNGKEWTTAKGWECYTTVGQTNSDTLAECMYSVAEETLPSYGLTIRTDKSDGDMDKESNFTIIYGANMPAVLTENFFYTNVNETRFMLSDEGRDVIARIHVEGIQRFVEKMYGC